MSHPESHVHRTRRSIMLAALVCAPTLVLARRQSAAVARPDYAVADSAGVAALQSGDARQALASFQRSLVLRRRPVAMYNVGASYARLSIRDSALQWLDSASIYGINSVAQYRDDDDLKSLRGSPEFDALLARVQKRFAPCTEKAENRLFDFWAGDWDVRPSGGGPIVGHSVVQRVSGDCALLENWEAGNGTTGKSLNAWNAETKSWQQYWVGQGGVVTSYLTSHWDGPTIVFEATQQLGTQPALVRLSFTPLAPDQVRQHGEQSTDGGHAWVTTYDFTYYRRR